MELNDEASAGGDESSVTRPHGRDAVVASLLDAARRLFSERGVDNVSVRSIAEEANVNPGLIHRHFENKTALVAATFAEDAERALTQMSDADPSASARALFDFAVDNPSFAKTLASVLLGSTDLVAVLPTDGPLRRFREIMVETRGEESITDFLLVVAAGLGWVVFAPALQALAEIDNDRFASEREIMRERLSTIAAEGDDDHRA